MMNLWSRNIEALVPYQPGERVDPKDGFIKLNTNENPYPPSSRALRAIERAANDQLRLYPDPQSTELKSAIAKQLHVSPDMIFTGNGSDEVLALAWMAFFGRDKPIAFPDVTYSFYKVFCDLFKFEYMEIPLDENFILRPERYSGDYGGIIFPNPNAPTGIDLGIEAIRGLARNHRECVIIVDEAYVDFGSQSCISILDDCHNLIVVQTLSKSRSLAGLRVGWAVGHVGLIEGLDRVKNSFNSYTIDSVAAAGAAEAINDTEYFRWSCGSIIESRDIVSTQLRLLKFHVLPSKANFLFVRHSVVSADIIYEHLRSLRILVRHFKGNRTDSYLRITIGRPEEMSRLIEALSSIVQKV